MDRAVAQFVSRFWMRDVLTEKTERELDKGGISDGIGASFLELHIRRTMPQ